MKNLNLLFIILFITSSVFSQDIHFLKGIVQNDSIDVSDITITNKNLKQSTKTNNSGVFELPVRVGDSIKVSAIHINKVSLLMTQKIITEEHFEIKVVEKVNEMGVVVLNNVLSKSTLDFSAAYKPTTNPDPEKLERIKLKHLNNTDPTRNFQGVNLLGIIDLFKKDKKSKVLERRENYDRKENFKLGFIDEFGMSFFTKDLKISELIVDEFLNYCYRKKDISLMYFNNEKLELIDFMVKESKNYKRDFNMEE